MVNDAVARTEILFDARRPPFGEMPVVLAAGSSGVVLHEAIGHSLEADFVRTGESPYGDSINQRIADSAVTIVDDGALPNERGALNYDDEGLACRRNVLVENGVLRRFLHDRNTARQFQYREHGVRPARILSVRADAQDDMHVHGRRPAGRVMNLLRQWDVASSRRQSPAGEFLLAMAIFVSASNTAFSLKKARC